MKSIRHQGAGDGDGNGGNCDGNGDDGDGNGGDGDGMQQEGEHPGAGDVTEMESCQTALASCPKISMIGMMMCSRCRELHWGIINIENLDPELAHGGPRWPIALFPPNTDQVGRV